MCGESCTHRVKPGKSWRLPSKAYLWLLIESTRKTVRPMNNIMLRGDPSVGKTAGARAMAAGLNLPYTFVTCNAGTEMYNLVGDMMPEDSSGETAKSINEEMFADMPCGTGKRRQESRVLNLLFHAKAASPLFGGAASCNFRKDKNMELNQIGVTPRKEAQFKKRGIESVEDLLRCYPKEYRDYRVPVSVRTLKDRQDERAAVLGIVTGCRILQGKHAMVRLKDKDGGNISAVWFNQAFRVRQVVLGGSYIVGGMARWDEQYQSVSFLMPDLFESFEGFRFGIKPVYRKIPGMSEEYFSSVMEEALSHIDDMGDYLNDEECKALDVPNTADTFRLAHLPESMEDVRRAQRRVLVDNMYPFCREMEMKRMQAAAESPFVPLAAFETMEQIRTFLPYQLTEDQKNALRRMLHEMKTGKRLDVLLQGDVGCGKTIVAIILAACMSKSGYQTAVVCPTSVLAGQHLQAYMIASSAYGTLGAKSYADVQDADVPDAAANRQMPVKVVTTTASTAWVVYDSLGETFEVAVSHDAAILCVQESITFLRKTEQCYSRKDNNEYNAVKTAIQTDCDELPSITLYGKDNTTCEVIVVKRTIRKSPQEAQLPSGQAS